MDERNEGVALASLAGRREAGRNIA